MSTIEEQLRKLAPRSYVEYLFRPLIDRGFHAETAGYAHPSGVNIAMMPDGVQVLYPAEWADPERDLSAWFYLPYGTNFDVIIDLVEALIAKVDADRDAKDQPRGEVRGPGV